MITPRRVRAGRANSVVTDEGDGFVLPLVQGAVESVLECRCGAVIVLSDYRHEGVELTDTSAPVLCCGLREDTAGEHRGRRLAEKWQPDVAQVEDCKFQISPR
jgi:hypothetical protein